MTVQLECLLEMYVLLEYFNVVLYNIMYELQKSKLFSYLNLPKFQ